MKKVEKMGIAFRADNEKISNIGGLIIGVHDL